MTGMQTRAIGTLPEIRHKGQPDEKTKPCDVLSCPDGSASRAGPGCRGREGLSGADRDSHGGRSDRNAHSGASHGPTGAACTGVAIHRDREVPAGWEKKCTFYLGRGVVALAGEDGTKRMARSPNLPVAASPGKLSPGNWQVVRIAGCGQSFPLSARQLANLRSFGLCSPIACAPESGRTGTKLNLPAECCGGMSCTSGGECAASCSVGSVGCPASCSTGWYSCRNANTDNCRCCRNN